MATKARARGVSAHGLTDGVQEGGAGLGVLKDIAVAHGERPSRPRKESNWGKFSLSASCFMKPTLERTG